MYDAESSQLEAQKWNWSKPAVKLQFQGTSMRHVLARLQTDHGLAGGSAERRREAKEAGNISMPGIRTCCPSKVYGIHKPDRTLNQRSRQITAI